VQTAQTRLLIETTVTALGLGTITLPVYAEVAPAQATLRSLSCAGSGGRKVTLDAQTGLATLAIAQVPRTAINGGSASPDLSQPAPLVTVLGITVSGRALATLGTGSQTLVFSDADIANHTVRTVASGNLTQSLTGSLLRNLVLSVGDVGVPPLIQSTLTTALGTVTPGVDLVLDTVLRSLGLRLGYADLEVDGTLCNQAVLVQ